MNWKILLPPQFIGFLNGLIIQTNTGLVINCRIIVLEYFLMTQQKLFWTLLESKSFNFFIKMF